MTQEPASRAGRTVFEMCSYRAAICNKVSVNGAQRSPSPSTSSPRINSAPGAPPGSRVDIAPIPHCLRDSTNRLAWVDLPAPSPPSIVINCPEMIPAPLLTFAPEQVINKSA